MRSGSTTILSKARSLASSTCTASTRRRSASARCRSIRASRTASRSRRRRRRCDSRAAASASMASRRRRAAAAIAGAAYVGWNGTYSFNVQGRRVPGRGCGVRPVSRRPALGRDDVHGDRAAARFDDAALRRARQRERPLRARRRHRRGHRTPRRSASKVLTIELDAASPRLAVSGSGRIAMTPEADAELTFRFTDTSLDPYVRMLRAGLVAVHDRRRQRHAARGGRVADARSAASWTARVDHLQLRLFDYVVKNDGPIRLTLEGQNARIVGDAPRGRRHAARRQRHRRPREPADVHPRDGRCEPRHPAGLLPRHPQRGAGRSRRRPERHVRRPVLARPRGGRRRAHAPLRPAARARGDQRRGDVRRRRRHGSTGSPRGSAAGWCASAAASVLAALAVRSST